MVLEHIIYNSRCCTRKKTHAAPVYPLVPLLLQSQNLPGSPIRLPGGGHIITPDHHQHCQEVPKRNLAMPAAFLRFFGWIPVEWGGWGLPLFILDDVLLLGSLKE